MRACVIGMRLGESIGLREEELATDALASAIQSLERNNL